MNQKLKFAILVSGIYLAPLLSLPAQDTKENVKVNEKPATNLTDKAEKVEKSATTEKSEVIKSNTPDTTPQKTVNDKVNKKNKDNTDGKKESRQIEGNILKNPGLSEEFRESTMEDSAMEHGLVNVFYGLVSGGIMGFGGGLSFYTTSTNLTPLYVTAGALGAAGAVTGAIITMIEKSSHNPLLGNGLFEYSWYGALGGAAIGGLIGLVPYSTSTNLASLLNWVGYGTFAGLGTGIVLFIVLPKAALKNLILDTNPQQPRIGYRFQF